MASHDGHGRQSEPAAAAPHPADSDFASCEVSACCNALREGLGVQPVSTEGYKVKMSQRKTQNVKQPPITLHLTNFFNDNCL